MSEAESEETFDDLYGLWLILQQDFNDELDFDRRATILEQQRECCIKMSERFPAEYIARFVEPIQ